jgi:hypothetical protein
MVGGCRGCGREGIVADLAIRIALTRMTDPTLAMKAGERAAILPIAAWRLRRGSMSWR